MNDSSVVHRNHSPCEKFQIIVGQIVELRDKIYERNVSTFALEGVQGINQIKQISLILANQIFELRFELYFVRLIHFANSAQDGIDLFARL